MAQNRPANFGAGPSQIPLEVLVEAQKDFLNIFGSGMSILEVSHRGPVFDKIIKEAEDDLRTILSIPSNYKVLFLQTGATGQFAGVPLNLLHKSAGGPPDYLVSGRWSQLASEEARLYTTPGVVSSVGKFTAIPEKKDWVLNEKAAYLYYCDNETIHGIEYPFIPTPPASVPLVCDMSSNFLSRPFDITKFAVVYAGAQKNCGMAGLTILILREDLLALEKVNVVPTVLNWKKNSDMGSRLNTPPTMAIYIAGLVFKWILKQGGLKAMEELSEKKSKMVYDTIEKSNGFYKCIVEKGSRSRMNVVFTIQKQNLTEKFILESASQGLLELGGHRSVGGLRASLYNAVTVEQVERLVCFMKEFKEKNE